MKKLVSLAILVGLISLVPTPPIGNHAMAEREKPPSTKNSTLTTNSTHVEALESTSTKEVVHTTAQPQTPVVDISMYPTEPSEIMEMAGISASDQFYVRFIVDHEGGWCPSRWQGQLVCTGVFDSNYNSLDNPNEGFGLCQSTPGNKMASAGDDYINNPVTQMRWCDQYAISRYGSWGAAYEHWLLNRNW